MWLLLNAPLLDPFSRARSAIEAPLPPAETRPNLGFGYFSRLSRTHHTTEPSKCQCRHVPELSMQ